MALKARQPRQSQAGGEKPAASSAVVRDKTLAVPRLVMNPLVELIRPPPSDFCSSTTPIRAMTSIR